MKTLLLTISLLLTSLLFSQEIKTENKKYYIDGVHVYRHEMKNILETNLKASNLYKKQIKKKLGEDYLLVVELVYVLQML